MDVYELILERGTIGALLYANEIENTNMRTASNIDRAVNNLIKISQVPSATLPQFQPTVQTTTRTPYEQPEDKGFGEGTKQIITPRDPKNTFLVGGGAVANIGSDIYKSIQLLNKWKLTHPDGINKLIEIVKTGTPEEQEAAKQTLSKLINRSPTTEQIQLFTKDILGNKYDPKSMISGKELLTKNKLIEQIKNSLGDDAAEIINESAHSQTSVISKLKNLTPTIKNKSLSPLLKSLNLSEDAEKLLVGKNPKEWSDILANADGLSNDFAKVEQALVNSSKAEEILAGSQASKVTKVLQAGAEAEGPMASIFQKVLGWAKSPWFGKLLMAVGIAFQAYDIYSDIDKYGLDSRTICKILGIIASAASFIPPAAPVAIPISLALSFGCSLIPRQEADDPISVEDIKSRANTVTSSDLPSEDLQKLQTMANEAIQNNSNFYDAAVAATKALAFKHTLDSIALAFKYQFKDPKAIPGITQKPTTEPTQDKTSNFNLKQYRIAFSN
jgi:hypothetical protein